MLIAILVFSILGFLLMGLWSALFTWFLISDSEEKKQAAEKEAVCKKDEITQEQK